MTARVYLDYNATTPLEPEVLNSITGALKDAWGNPSSSHEAGKSAKVIIDTARKHVAGVVGAAPEDIIFTSGGTESNNLVIWSSIKEFQRNKTETNNTTGQRPHIVTSNLEHDSIRLVLQTLEKESSAEVTYVPASKHSGRVEVSDVVAAIRPNTCLITIMMANNETGIIQPVEEICSRVKSLNNSKERLNKRILLHTDAAQTIGKVKVDAAVLGVDYLTIVGQKFYGPRIGALYVKSPNKGTPIHPMFFGGGQERNFRPGTENTGMIAGLGKAAELIVTNLDRYQTHMEVVRDYLETKLEEIFPGKVHFNGKYESSARIPNTCNVSIIGPGLSGDRVLSRCKHLQASVGAACHSSAGARASPILLAIGIPPDVAKNAIRLSMGRHTTKEDIDVVVGDIQQAVDSIQREAT